MSYIVHVSAVVEGDLDEIEALINEYRYLCLENQPGMEHFYVCRHIDQNNVFLYTTLSMISVVDLSDPHFCTLES